MLIRTCIALALIASAAQASAEPLRFTLHCKNGTATIGNRAPQPIPDRLFSFELESDTAGRWAMPGKTEWAPLGDVKAKVLTLKMGSGVGTAVIIDRMTGALMSVGLTSQGNPYSEDMRCEKVDYQDPSAPKPKF